MVLFVFGYFPITKINPLSHACKHLNKNNLAVRFYKYLIIRYLQSVDLGKISQKTDRMHLTTEISAFSTA